MLIDPSLIPTFAHILASLCLVISVFVAVWKAPWQAFRRAPQRQHLLFGSLALIVLLWTLSIQIAPGIRVHMLGMTTLTLMLGWPLAIIGGSLILTLKLAIGPMPFLALPLSWLLTVGLPATTSRLLVVGLRHFGGPNPYLFVLGAGFGGGVASVLVVAAASGGLFTILGLTHVFEGLRPMLPLLALAAFPEGFVNGVIVTSITVVKPSWVKTFDESYYQHSEP